jgi:hypothetical protein
MLLFLSGIGKDGMVTAQSYTTLYCNGEMAGGVELESYATW